MVLCHLAIQEGTWESTPCALSPGATRAYRLIVLLTGIAVCEKNRPFSTLKPTWMVYRSFVSQIARADCSKGKTTLRNGGSSPRPSCTATDSYRPADGIIDVRLLQATCDDMRKLGVV